MVVKEIVGRHRYILFYTNEMGKNEIVRRIKKYGDSIKLAFYNGKYCIVKIPHKEKEQVIGFLRNVGIETIKTSGTIKKLKKLISSSLQA